MIPYKIAFSKKKEIIWLSHWTFDFKKYTVGVNDYPNYNIITIKYYMINHNIIYLNRRSRSCDKNVFVTK